MKLLLLLLLTFFTPALFAASVATLSLDGVTFTLYNEPCALSAVANLPYRATWKEKGETTEGCYTIHPGAGAVVAYFADKTVVLAPVAMFGPVTDI